MTPNIKVGDAVVVDKTANKEKLKEKDIIAYKNDDGIIVIHRIISTYYNTPIIVLYSLFMQ